MDGYYDPIVSHFLDKPVCLCGFWGARVPEIAVLASSYTGIPFADLERKIEHRLGASLCSLYAKGHLGSLDEVEHECLRHLLSSRPYPIVSLRPETLMQPRNARLVANKMRLIYIKKDIFSLFATISKIRARKEKNRLMNLQFADPEDLHSVNRLLKSVEGQYTRADQTIYVEKDEPRAIAKDVIALLDACRL